jgi:hypothetical protein
MLRIARYKNTRHWAVYEGQTLIAVTLYKRGALEVLRRLRAHAVAIECAQAEEGEGYPLTGDTDL